MKAVPEGIGSGEKEMNPFVLPAPDDGPHFLGNNLAAQKAEAGHSEAH